MPSISSLSARTARLRVVIALATLACAESATAATVAGAYVSHAGQNPLQAAAGESRHMTSRRLLSADGRWAVFASQATDLWGVVTDTNGTWDTMIEDQMSGTTLLVSHLPGLGGATGNGESVPRAISADGRFVAFSSLATDLVTGVTDVNGTWDAFLWDRSTGLISLLSRSSFDLNRAANLASHPSRLSADGSWVLLRSLASDLFAGAVTDENSAEDVFLCERATGQVRLVSHIPPSEPEVYQTGNAASSPQTMSADGRYVAFLSAATDLVPGLADDNVANDVYLWDRVSDTMTLVSHAPGSASTAADGASGLAFSLSADGRFLAYQSKATNLTPQAGTPTLDVFLFDRQTGENTLVSHGHANPNTEANGASEPQAISADGRHLLFSSAATDLLLGFADQNGSEVDAWSWDRSTGAIALLSHQAGSPTTGANGRALPRAASADGRFVTLESEATNLVSPQSDVNAAADVFVWDRASNNALLLSGSQGSTQATGDGASSAWAMDARGGWITLETSATNLIASGTDTNGTWDVVRVVNPLAPFFSDGFESSDASAWSAVVGGE